MLLNAGNRHVGGLVSLNVKPRAIKKLHLHKSTARGHRKMHGFWRNIAKTFSPRLNTESISVGSNTALLRPPCPGLYYLLSSQAWGHWQRQQPVQFGQCTLSLYHQVGKWWRSWSLILIMENIQKYNNTEYNHTISASSKPPASHNHKRNSYSMFIAAMFSMILLIFASHELPSNEPSSAAPQEWYRHISHILPSCWGWSTQGNDQVWAIIITANIDIFTADWWRL